MKTLSIRYASHNSLSYSKPQWYLRPLAWVGRCQNKDIFTQFESGVQLFDIRVKFKNGVAVSGHGLLTYDIEIHDVLFLLDVLAEIKNTLIYVRISLEKSTPESKQLFKLFCSTLSTEFKFLAFYGGQQKKDWTTLYVFNTEYPGVTEKYWTFSRKLFLPFPYLYAKLFNKKYISNHDTTNFLMLDFI